MLNMIRTLESAQIGDEFMCDFGRYRRDWKVVTVVNMTPKQITISAKNKLEKTYKFRKRDARSVGTDSYYSLNLYTINDEVLLKQMIDNRYNFIKATFTGPDIKLTDDDINTIYEIVKGYKNG